MSNSNFIKSTLLAISILATTSAVFTPTVLGQTSPLPTSVEQPSVSFTLSGTFEGRTNHVTKGSVTLSTTASGYILTLSDDFYLDGAPDPVIGFGTSGKYMEASKINDLKSKRGAQAYELPEGLNPTQFNEVYVWCERFSVPLGVATLRQN